MTARHHHFVPQYYLKGFTKGRSKNSKLFSVDLSQKKYFETRPRNVGGKRDFNKIQVEGIEANALEDELAKFDSKAAKAIKNVEKYSKFNDEDKEIILNLVALLALRTPYMREHNRKNFEKLSKRVMDVALSKKEIWESQLRQMKEKGIDINYGVTYEEIKEFHKSGEYDIQLPNEYHINLEFKGIDAIYPYLYKRNWLLIRTTDESGPFITTDNPVIIYWVDLEKIPPALQHSPGYGMKNTEVYFPISSDIAMLGSFDRDEGLIDAPGSLVAGCNTRMLMYFDRQVYAPKLEFYYYDDDMEIKKGSEFVAQYCK